MADSFTELGISSELAAGLTALGYQRPTSIQRAAIPVIRRGGNVVIQAATGAGAGVAYGLAVIDRLRELGVSDEATQVLVVTPTEERASAIALQLGRLGRAANVRATVPGAAWAAEATIVVVPIGSVMRLVESSTLKLESVKAVVLHDLSAMLAHGHQETVETLFSTMPREAQRIIVTSASSSVVDKIAEAHARRALHIPARAALADAEPASPAATVELECRVVSERDVAETVAELAAVREGVTVFCRNDRLARELRSELDLRGVAAEVALYGTSGNRVRSPIGAGSPFDVESLNAAFPDGGAVVITTKEMSHLRELAKHAGQKLRVSAAAPRESSGLVTFRDQIRRALQEEDIDAELLVIAPLLDEFSAAEVAAAAAALLRKRTPEAAAPSRSGPAPASAGAFVKLFLSVGTKDGIAAREIVGAITGEANIQGNQVGRVEIRDTFSIVEVSAEAGDRVIKALNGTSLKGRSLRVDYDRGRGTAPRRTTQAPTRRTRQ